MSDLNRIAELNRCMAEKEQLIGCLKNEASELRLRNRQQHEKLRMFSFDLDQVCLGLGFIF